MKKRFILASGSPRRKRLLSELGFEFDVDPARKEESLDTKGDAVEPAEYAERLALRKAEEVAGRHEGAVILAADTIVVLDDDILGKPAGAAEAAQMLGRLAGRTHVVVTGYAIIDLLSGERRVGYEVTRVHVRELDKALIGAYVDTGESLDKAGAYAIQGLGSALVEWVEGCFYNVVGLPVPRIAAELEAVGLSLREAWRGLDKRVRPEVIGS